MCVGGRIVSRGGKLPQWTAALISKIQGANFGSSVRNHKALQRRREEQQQIMQRAGYCSNCLLRSNPNLRLNGQNLSMASFVLFARGKRACNADRVLKATQQGLKKRNLCCE